MPQTLKRAEILRGTNAVREVFERGQRVPGAHLRCIFSPNPAGKIVAAFFVPRGIRRAVDRNRIKRLMRESFRRNRSLLLFRPRPVRLLFTFSLPSRSLISSLTYKDIDRDMKYLLTLISSMKESAI